MGSQWLQYVASGLTAGAIYALVALGFFGLLHRGEILPRQCLLPLVRGDALGQNGTGARQRRLGAALAGGIGGKPGAGAGNAGLLFGRMKPRQDIAFPHPVSLVGKKFGEGRADLEADLGDDARFNRAEPENPHRRVLLHFRDTEGDRPFCLPKISGRQHSGDGQHDDNGNGELAAHV